MQKVNVVINNSPLNTSSDIIDYCKTNLPNDYFELSKIWFSKDNKISFKTSGTTHIPKSIIFEKFQIIESILRTSNYFSLGLNSKVILGLPLNFIAGKMMFLRGLYLGWNMTILPICSDFLSKTSSYFDFTAMTPFQFQKTDVSNLNKVKKILLGGSAISAQTTQKNYKTDSEVFLSFGMTETLTHIAIKKLLKNTSLENQPPYQTLENIEVSVDDNSCLQIKNVFSNIDLINTNEIVEIIDSKTFHWIGRKDNIINTGGINVNPELLESKIAKYINLPFFITSIRDNVLGNKIILLIETKEKLEKSVIFNSLKDLLYFEKPKDIFFLPEFIRTTSNKIDRNNSLKHIIDG